MAEDPDVVVIVPMKPSADGKTRLARRLTVDQRADLVVGMLRRVIMAIQGASENLLWVVGGDRRVRNLARNLGALWMEGLGRNLNNTLGKAIDLVFEQGKSVLYVAGDLPFLKASDIHSLLLASQRCNNVSLAPARRDGGTNGILVPHGFPFRPQLGRGSFTRHLSQAAKLGVPVAICTSPGLGFDLDTSADLEAYQLMEPDLLRRLVLPVRPRSGARL